jgi:hypothetical protein
MSDWLSILILISGIAVFTAGVGFFLAFLSYRRKSDAMFDLQKQAFEAARLPSGEAQPERQRILASLRARERTGVFSGPDSHVSANVTRAKSRRV